MVTCVELILQPLPFVSWEMVFNYNFFKMQKSCIQSNKKYNYSIHYACTSFSPIKSSLALTSALSPAISLGQNE